MFIFLSVLSGSLIAVMIVQNADLAYMFGTYHSTVIVHVVGLSGILLWILIKREKLHWDITTPWHYYFGGVLGVLTVFLANLTFFSLGVSLTLSLQLLGQCIAGGFLDHFGCFGLPKKPFLKQHLFSFALIIAGILIMCLQ